MTLHWFTAVAPGSKTFICLWKANTILSQRELLISVTLSGQAFANWPSLTNHSDLFSHTRVFLEKSDWTPSCAKLLTHCVLWGHAHAGLALTLKLSVSMKKSAGRQTKGRTRVSGGGVARVSLMHFSRASADRNS